MEKQSEPQRQAPSMTTVCAWCKKVLQWGSEPTIDFALGRISHGICAACAKDVKNGFIKKGVNHGSV